MEPMNGVEEKKRSHFFVQIVVLLSEPVQGLALLEKRLHRSGPAIDV
jgi:hypothetical protein